MLAAPRHRDLAAASEVDSANCVHEVAEVAGESLKHGAVTGQMPDRRVVDCSAVRDDELGESQMEDAEEHQRRRAQNHVSPDETLEMVPSAGVPLDLPRVRRIRLVTPAVASVPGVRRGGESGRTASTTPLPRSTAMTR